MSAAPASESSPRDDATHHPDGTTKKLSQAELEAVTQRLFYQQAERSKALETKRRQTLDAVRPPPKPLTQESTQNLVQRIYTAPMDKRKRVAEDIQKKREELNASAKTLSEADTTEMVQRMFYQEQQKAATNMKSLKAKYQPDRELNRLDKAHQDSLGDRLAKGVHEKRAEARKKLFDKYIAPMEPPKRTISPADVKKMADRLCTSKK